MFSTLEIDREATLNTGCHRKYVVVLCSKIAKLYILEQRVYLFVFFSIQKNITTLIVGDRLMYIYNLLKDLCESFIFNFRSCTQASMCRAAFTNVCLF